MTKEYRVTWAAKVVFSALVEADTEGEARAIWEKTPDLDYTTEDVFVDADTVEVQQEGQDK